MPTIIRERGFEVMIYPNDHRPPHVHVWKAGKEARVVRLERGDILAVVTDGLIEIEDAAGRELGLAGLQALLSREPDGPERLVEGLLATAKAHGPQTDDQSALVVRYEG
jgi:serine phosphatase RsbU (regulator of sigma subunit)